MTTSQGQVVGHILTAICWTVLALVFIADIFMEQKEAPKPPVVCQCKCDGSKSGR